MNTQDLKTTCYKAHYGWTAQTTTDADQNGEAWQISTSKARGGVACTAVKGKLSGDLFSYEMFGAERLELAFNEGLCNEKKVRETHSQGLIKFIELVPQNVAPAYVVGVGQIIFTDWIQSGEGQRRVIYEVVSSGNYKTVQLDGKGFHNDDRIKPYSQKFGIGTYYNEGETLSIEEVNVLVEAATIWLEMQEQKEILKAEADKQYKQNAILEGSKIISEIPTHAKCVIVAELKQNDSDYQADYFASSVQRVVYLAFSSHDKNNFAEMKKAAATFEETAIFNTEGDEYENRENYSGGSGYYLGESKYSGWVVRKYQTPSLETLQIAAFEGRFKCELTEESVNVAPVEVEAGKIQVIEYGSGLAVVGDTRPIKDTLKALGGRFNFRLTCGAGWVFPKSKLEELQTALTA